MQKGFSSLVILGLVVLLITLGLFYFGFRKYYSNIQLTSSGSSQANYPIKQPLTALDETVKEATVSSVGNWKTYVDPTYNFSFKYPPDWNISESYINDQTSYSSGVPEFTAKNYNIGFILDGAGSDQGALNVGVDVYDNPENWSLGKWLDFLDTRSGQDPMARSDFVVNGFKGVKTQIAPAFENVFVNYISNDKKVNKVYYFNFFGNGEGGSNYPDNDPFVVKNKKNFELMLSSFKFSDQGSGGVAEQTGSISDSQIISCKAPRKSGGPEEGISYFSAFCSGDLEESCQNIKDKAKCVSWDAVKLDPNNGSVASGKDGIADCRWNESNYCVPL